MELSRNLKMFSQISVRALILGLLQGCVAFSTDLKFADQNSEVIFVSNVGRISTTLPWPEFCLHVVNLLRQSVMKFIVSIQLLFGQKIG